MKPVLRALLVLGLATLLHTTRTDQKVSVKLWRRTKLKGSIGRLVLDPSVQPQIGITSASTIANMSLSPWTYRESCIASRLPRHISHAQCLTSGCLSLQGEGEDTGLVAKPIYYQVLVLHRVPRQRHNNSRGGKPRKKYDFKLGTEVITVGCTCVRPAVVTHL
ncbi:interleukin 17a/f3 [Morone saxatilis]|uniref:interleukin 17a/f3 n=1 Tax=Morone saxatilis TaxID=34816 RepID=UPI0015E1CD85|nr:interleukin 17a/f3 [Morone saxatilis]